VYLHVWTRMPNATICNTVEQQWPMVWFIPRWVHAQLHLYYKNREFEIMISYFMNIVFVCYMNIILSKYEINLHWKNVYPFITIFEIMISYWVEIQYLKVFTLKWKTKSWSLIHLRPRFMFIRSSERTALIRRQNCYNVIRSNNDSVLVLL